MRGRLRSVADGFLLAAREAPGTLARLVTLNAVAGLAPAAMLVIQKIVIDAIAESGAADGLRALFGSPWKLVAAAAAFVGLHLVLDAVEQFIEFEAGTFYDRIVIGAKRFIWIHLRNIRGVGAFETPAFASRLKLAFDAIPSMDYFGNALNYALLGGLAVVPLTAVCATLGWWVPLLTIAVVAPSAFVRNRIEDRTWSLREAQAETAKRMDGYERMLAGSDYAKDTRLLGVAGTLERRWRNAFDGALRQVMDLRARSRRAVLIWSLVSAAGVSAAFLYVVRQGSTGRCRPAIWRSTSARSST